MLEIIKENNRATGVGEMTEAAAFVMEAKRNRNQAKTIFIGNELELNCCQFIMQQQHSAVAWLVTASSYNQSDEIAKKTYFRSEFQ
jgi:hypothetical protein